MRLKKWFRHALQIKQIVMHLNKIQERVYSKYWS
jgi:hypothetical protein